MVADGEEVPVVDVRDEKVKRRRALLKKLKKEASDKLENNQIEKANSLLGFGNSIMMFSYDENNSQYKLDILHTHSATIVSENIDANANKKHPL